MAKNLTIKINDTEVYRWLKDGNKSFEMTVGVHEEDMGETHKRNNVLSVGAIAEISEFGAGNIPARKWLSGWVPNARAFGAEIGGALRNMIQANRGVDFTGLNVVAQRMRDSVRFRIHSGQIKPKNHPETLRRKRPETRPLVETHQFEEAIQAAVMGPGPWKFKTGNGQGTKA